MCSIVGGTKFDETAFKIYQNAKDRGRDFTGMCERHGLWVANHRATPTTENDAPRHNQPFGATVKVVHNGVISNDKDLGVKEGEIDSSVLAEVLDFTSLAAMRDSLAKVEGSYALAAMTPETIYLACNYKPIWIGKKDNEYYFSSLEHHFEGTGIRPYRMKPYSVMNLLTGETHDLPRQQSNRAIVICSGGLDSTAVAAYACHEHGAENVLLVHFRYGCKAQKPEVMAIPKIAERLGCKHKFMELPYTDMTGNSPILQSGDTISESIEGAEYAHEWVPARNFLFMAYTVAFAEANNYGHIYLGTNLEEGGAYPDNEEQFIRDVNACLYGAVQNGVKIEIHTPLGNLMKREIVEFGTKYNAPFDLSWSCYRDDDCHCGHCGPCYMRKMAFMRAGIADPTKYEE